ncbi:MAG: ribonuclease H-like domain-containing protein [Chromatiales bacterium]|nr:ribonuclease H-like domain-containing protein [Chromatiales bacterium]
MRSSGGDLRSRLANLHRGGPLGQDRAAPSLSERLRRAGRRSLNGEAPDDSAECQLAERIGGKQIAPGLILTTERVPFTPHGSMASHSLLWKQGEYPGTTLLALDTETTGLAGGSGTTAFLIGIAVRVPGDRIELRQWLLTRFSAEALMLGELAKAVGEEFTLLSYNGKSFDLPLLSTRFRLHRSADPLVGFPHLDLLPAVRRVFTGSWSDCRLASAERHLLNRARVDDLPGSAAPEAWRDWLTRGRMEELIGVLRHNRQDLLSLFALTDALARIYAGDLGPEADVVALARFHARAGRMRMAMEILEYRQSVLGMEGRQFLANLYKRAKRWEEAVEIWKNDTANGSLKARIELAKYYEHIAHDPVAALQIAADAEDLSGHVDDALQLRVARLNARCNARPWNGSLF